MRKISYLLVFFSILASGCEDNRYAIPGCIEDKIDSFRETVICDNGAYIAHYTFQGKNVYVFNEGTCGADTGATVYSEDCYYLGFLGGLAGNSFINGIDFFDNCKLVRIIWEN